MTPRVVKTAEEELEVSVSVISPAELAKHSTEKDIWLAIDGVVYDCTRFLAVHPGGDDLIQAAGSDATVIFHCTHPQWVRDSLKNHALVRVVGSYPTGQIMDPTFFEFQEHILRAIGGSKKSSLDWIALAVLTAAFFGGWLAMMLAPTSTVFLLLCAVHGVISVLIGFIIMHGYNHGSFPRRPFWANKWAQFMGEVIGGINNVSYRWYHNVLHHTDTNGSEDADVDVWPILRQRPDQPHLFFHRFQFIYAYIIYGLAIMIVEAKFSFATLFLAPRTRAQLLDFLAIKAVNIVMFFVIPYHLGWPVFAGWVTRAVVAGLVYTSVISLNHQHADTLLEHGYPGRGSRTEWFSRQLHCTKDTAPDSWWLNLFTGGLSLHVVHHTLPSLSMWLLPRATTAAREFLAQRGLPYRPHANFWDGLVSHQRMLRLLGSPELWVSYCKAQGISEDSGAALTASSSAQVQVPASPSPPTAAKGVDAPRQGRRGGSRRRHADDANAAR